MTGDMTGLISAPSMFWYVTGDNGVKLGYVLLHSFTDDGSTCQIGYAISNPCDRNRGAMTAALRQMLKQLPDGLRVIEAVSRTNNPASTRVLDKLGFAREREAEGYYWYRRIQ